MKGTQCPIFGIFIHVYKHLQPEYGLYSKNNDH